MTDTNYMVNITQRELKQLVRQNRSRIGEPEQRMIREHRAYSHRARMKNRFMTETAQTSMTMNNLNLLTNHNVPEHRKKGENCRESRLAVDNEEGYMVDFEPIGEIPNTGPSFVCVGDDDDFMPAVDEFLRYVSVAFSRG